MLLNNLNNLFEVGALNKSHTSFTTFNFHNLFIYYFSLLYTTKKSFNLLPCSILLRARDVTNGKKQGDASLGVYVRTSETTKAEVEAERHKPIDTKSSSIIVIFFFKFLK